jgi:tetratricopeptide (TPR) repeat protein
VLALGAPPARAQNAPKPPPKPPALDPRLPKPAQAAQLAARAEALHEQRKYPDAAKLFQQAAELTPEDWALWDRAGWAWLDAAQAAPALKAFEGAAKAAPAGSPPPGGLLISRFALGEAKEVEALLRRLLTPEAVDAALPIVTKGLAAKQFAPDWSYALGYLYARVLRNSQRALGPLESVAKAVPTHAGAWLLLVEVNQDLDRGAQEDAAALRYLQLAPDTPDAFRLKAQRYAAAQNFAGAIQEYEAGIAKHPAAAELYYPLARVYERVKNAKQAEATYRKLLTGAEARKQEAVVSQARQQLANYFARQKNYAEAEKLYREAAQKPDASLLTVENWAALLALAGNWEEAAGAYQALAGRVEKTPAPPEERLEARYRSAAAALAAGKRDAAKSEVQAALAHRPETRTASQAEALALAAWLGESIGAGLDYRKADERWAAFVWRSAPEEGEFEVRGRFSVAATAWRALLQQVQKRHPDSWAVDYALARQSAAWGATPEALAQLQRVTRARPTWWVGFYALGQYYSRERDKEKGVPVLRKVLELAPECRGARVYLSLLTNLKEDPEKDGDE